MIGRGAVIHLVDEDIYLDIRFLSWTQSRGGGGFSYERSTCSTVAIDIKANNSDNAITIHQADQLIISVSLDASDQLGTNADLWAVAVTSFGNFHYSQENQTWLPGIAAMSQEPLFNIPSLDLLNISGLPVGSYTFYFGYDPVMNGSLELGELLFDRIRVEVTP